MKFIQKSLARAMVFLSHLKNLCAFSKALCGIQSKNLYKLNSAMNSGDPSYLALVMRLMMTTIVSVICIPGVALPWAVDLAGTCFA